jgi:phage terminase small subunit
MAALPAISLNDRQAAFVEALLSGSPPKLAAEQAGYSLAGANITRLLSAPQVQAAIEIGLRKKLHGELVPLAFSVLQRILSDDSGKYGERVQLDAAKIALDRGGFIPVKQSVIDDGEQAPEQMTTDQLHAMVERLEREIGERAKVIAPSDDPSAW